MPQPTGPLSGIRIIELSGIGPGPFAGRLLADMGAEVISIDRQGGLPPMIDARGKKSVVLDLRRPEAVEALLKLVEQSDALIEGFRPGVTERLGVGPDICRARNPRLVYGRMTGWGQAGPYAKMAGHDLNYLSITGALQAIGPSGDVPPPPLNLIGDYGGGAMFLVAGVLAALLKAQRTGEGDVVDAAIIDGTHSMMGIIHSLSAMGLWQGERQANLLDGGMPYYRCYRTSDDRFMAVACIEPQFFAVMLERLNLNPKDFGGQNDAAKRDAQHKILEEVFAGRSQAEWQELFDGTDACVTPVLDYQEALSHPQNIARGSHRKAGAFQQPAAAPRFQRSPQGVDMNLPKRGAHTKEVLMELGLTDDELAQLLSA